MMLHRLADFKAIPIKIWKCREPNFTIIGIFRGLPIKNIFWMLACCVLTVSVPLVSGSCSCLHVHVMFMFSVSSMSIFMVMFMLHHREH